MAKVVFRGSDLRIRPMLEGWSKDFGAPFDGNLIIHNGEHGECKVTAKYMPSGLEFALIEFNFKEDYFVELIPNEREAYILWVDVPHNQTPLDKINSPDFHLTPKLVFIHNKMNFNLPRRAPAKGYSFLINIHPQLLYNLLSGPNWKSIFNWYFNCYVTNLDFIKINAIELNIANNLLIELNGNNSIITCEKYLYQLLEMFFLKLEKKYNSINKKNNLLEIETVYMKKLNELMQEQFSTGTVNKEKIIEELGLSKYQLDKLIKKVYDIRFGEYHTSEKLAFANGLLTTKEMDVYEVATQIGYADSSSFIEAFKNKYKKTPLEIKKDARKARNT